MLKKSESRFLGVVLSLLAILGYAAYTNGWGEANLFGLYEAQDHPLDVVCCAIVAVPPHLNVAILADSGSTYPGGQVRVDVKVSSGNFSEPGASVNVSASAGFLTPTTGVTDSHGVLTVEFTAPQVLESTNVAVNATASLSGFLPGSSQIQLTVNPNPSPPPQPASFLNIISSILGDLFVPGIVSLAVITVGTASFLLARRLRRPKSQSRSPREPSYRDLETSEATPPSQESDMEGSREAPSPDLSSRSSSYKSTQIESTSSGAPSAPIKPESDFVTGRVSVQATMKPTIEYPLNVALIGEKLEETTKILRGRIVETRPFHPTSPGPVLIRPHGKADRDFEVRPLTRSSGIPRTGDRYDFAFNIICRSDAEGPTKLFVDFEQDGNLLARANADVKISKIFEGLGTIEATVHVPYVPFL